MELNSDFSPEEMSQTAVSSASRVMPALAGGTAAYVHSLDSALVTLEALGIGAHRIRIRRVGRDARPVGTVARQIPAAGSSLSQDALVELDVVGLGYTQSLPVGMWDSGGEAAMGTREILECLDDPLEKLKHWFHEGAPLFRLAPDDPAACARWLALFGVVAEDWPHALWYRLASLVADLPDLAASEEGCASVLGTLLTLPVRSFTYRPSFSPLGEFDLSRLGERASRLGVDALLGDIAEDLAIVEIKVGPVSLETYERFAESDSGASLLRQVLALVMPLFLAYQVTWLVEDPSRPPQLGVAAQNARLGVNSHMGRALPVVSEAALPAGPKVFDLVSGAMNMLGSNA